MKRKVLIILCLVGIFAAGGATGALVSLRVVKNLALEKSMTNTFVPRQLARMTKELDLTPEQTAQVNRILWGCASDIETVRRDSFRESASKLREMNQKISAILTPDQNAKFEEMLEHQRERIRRFQAERSERVDGHRGTDGAPPPPPPTKP